jgi:SAM-dependent methyltransferase
VTSPDWSHLPAAYDVVADEYAATFSDELDGKPFDRDLLDALARDVAGTGVVCDLGCGPAQVAAYLAERGCEVVGVDVSPGMLRAAAERHPGLRLQLGDLRAIPLADASCVAAAAFYSLIHVPRAEVPGALAEVHRVLRPGGALLLAVHGGVGEVHVDDWFGRQVAFDGTLFAAAELRGLTEDAGFVDCTVTERPPYPAEHPTPRLYLRATRG